MKMIRKNGFPCDDEIDVFETENGVCFKIYGEEYEVSLDEMRKEAEFFPEPEKEEPDLNELVSDCTDSDFIEAIEYKMSEASKYVRKEVIEMLGIKDSIIEILGGKE